MPKRNSKSEPDLTPVQAEVRDSLRAGLSVPAIAELRGVGQATIYNTRRRLKELRVDLTVDTRDDEPDYPAATNGDLAPSAKAALEAAEKVNQNGGLLAKGAESLSQAITEARGLMKTRMEEIEAEEIRLRDEKADAVKWLDGLDRQREKVEAAQAELAEL